MISEFEEADYIITDEVILIIAVMDREDRLHLKPSLTPVHFCLLNATAMIVINFKGIIWKIN